MSRIDASRTFSLGPQLGISRAATVGGTLGPSDRFRIALAKQQDPPKPKTRPSAMEFLNSIEARSSLVTGTHRPFLGRPPQAGPAGIFLAPDGDLSMELKKLAAIRESY